MFIDNIIIQNLKNRTQRFIRFSKKNRKMKKALSILIVGIATFGCSNNNIGFDDFDYQAIYFPYQSPVRTIILGDESIGDNSIDLEEAFNIGVTMGGAYENVRDRSVTLEYAPELGANVVDLDGNPMEILPANYYNASFGEVIIPEGDFAGRMRVDLTDQFFADPLSTSTHYFLPVRITDTDGDTILSGDPNIFVDNPDPRVAEDWSVPPKDYTLFGIKYINPLHGLYFVRGTSVNTSKNIVNSYSERFLTDNTMVRLTTLAKDKCIMHTMAGIFTGNELFTMVLTFNEDNKTITISRVSGSTVSVSGTGTYVTKEDPESESYNGQKHRTMYLDYTFSRGDTYTVNDTLVFVDTDVVFEQFDFTVEEP
jgi:hypothetical protein